jgi:bacillithiol biosynthesis deacetylase BshB1
MKLDLLAIVAHPDDAELGCGGTLIMHARLGYKTGVIDLTEGEMGTRGTSESRREEAKNASAIMGLSVRENLKFSDARFDNDEPHRLKVIQKIRQYQPSIIITNAPDDRHPDHARAAGLVKQAAWLAGLEKYETSFEGEVQIPWRPKHVYHVIQYNMLVPDLVVDISGYVDKKMEAIMAYSTQFYNPESKEAETLIARPQFIEFVKSRIIAAGNYALIDNGEAFISAYKPAVKNLFDLV